MCLKIVPSAKPAKKLSFLLWGKILHGMFDFTDRTHPANLTIPSVKGKFLSRFRSLSFLPSVGSSRRRRRRLWVRHAEHHPCDTCVHHGPGAHGAGLLRYL